MLEGWLWTEDPCPLHPNGIGTDMVICECRFRSSGCGIMATFLQSVMVQRAIMSRTKGQLEIVPE